MATTLPALRGRMGDSEFFATMLTFGEVARMVEFVEDVDDWDSETAPEEKTQRRLNVQRVDREMVPYLVETDDHFYSAITVEVRPSLGEEGEVIPFRPAGDLLPGGIQYGEVVLDGTQTLCALDGQHRLKSIQRAIRLKQSLAREQLAVILVPFRSSRHSQLLFSDLNRYAKGPSRSINLLFSHRDPLVTLTRRIIANEPFLNGRVEVESTSLSKNTPCVATLSTLYEMTRTFNGQMELDTPETLDIAYERQGAIWTALVRAVGPWTAVADRVEHPAYLRQANLCMHGVGQQAIALAASAVLAGADGNLEALGTFGIIDWSVGNRDWQGIAVQGRRVNNTAATVRNLGALLAYRLGCGVSPSAARTLAEAFRARGDAVPRALHTLAQEAETHALP